MLALPGRKQASAQGFATLRVLVSMRRARCQAPVSRGRRGAVDDAVIALCGLTEGITVQLEVLEPSAGSRHPPAEFFASPGTLGRIGVDDGAVAEDPAVHHQA